MKAADFKVPFLGNFYQESICLYIASVFVYVLGCEVEDLAHYHCKDDGCEMIFRHEDGVREHGRNHFIQDQISEMFFVREDPEDDPDPPECSENSDNRAKGLQFHCKWVSSKSITK